MQVHCKEISSANHLVLFNILGEVGADLKVFQATYLSEEFSSFKLDSK